MNFPKLIVQADPQWAGKHPMHDHRFITTDHQLCFDAPLEGGEGSVVFEDDTRDAQIIASMRDCEHQADYAHLFAAAPELLEALQAIVSTARTFRNVPKDEQEWTSIDETALNAAFAAIDKATATKGENDK